MSQVSGPSDQTAPSAGAPSTLPHHPHGFKRWIFLGLLAVGAVAISFMWYQGSHIDTHVYTATELERGPIAQIITWDGGRDAVQISRLSTRSADHLWRVVTDHGRFDEFMPYVESTSVRPGPDGTILEKQMLDLPHAKYDLELEIRLSEQDGTRRARWRQVQGTLSYNEGAWLVERQGQRSVLRYQVSASLGILPQWAVNYAMRRRLGRLLEAVERRVRDLEQREPGYFGI